MNCNMQDYTLRPYMGKVTKIPHTIKSNLQAELPQAELPHGRVATRVEAGTLCSTCLWIAFRLPPLDFQQNEPDIIACLNVQK